MIELLLLALALSMDAFAVSVGLGTQFKKNLIRLALLAGLYFGLFQGLMPLIGFFGGKSLLGWIGDYTQWIAFIILAGIGGKMIYEALTFDEEEEVVADKKLTQKTMLILAIATSIDAMAAGFALNLLTVNAYLACLIIGLVTFVFSGFGVWIGAKAGAHLESKAELLGGLVLIGIGINFLL